MCTAKAMAETYEDNRQICKYVHSTSRGHEAIQLATAFQLLPCDFVSPYYRDESMLLGLGFTPHELMLQLLAKGNDIFTGGREYYSHPNYRGEDKPGIIHQSSATGMQVIPTTGIAQGIKYLEKINSLLLKRSNNPNEPTANGFNDPCPKNKTYTQNRPQDFGYFSSFQISFKAFSAMLAIQSTLVSEEIIEKHFVCDLHACKGACCVKGASS